MFDGWAPISGAIVSPEVAFIRRQGLIVGHQGS
jgi:hypothetical protein